MAYFLILILIVCSEWASCFDSQEVKTTNGAGKASPRFKIKHGIRQGRHSAEEYADFEKMLDSENAPNQNTQASNEHSGFEKMLNADNATDLDALVEEHWRIQSKLLGEPNVNATNPKTKTQAKKPGLQQPQSEKVWRNRYGIGRKQGRANDGSFIGRGYERNPKGKEFGFKPLRQEHQNRKYGDPDPHEEHKLIQHVTKSHNIQIGKSMALTHAMFKDFSPGTEGEKIDHSSHPHALTVWPTLTGSPVEFIGHRGEKVFMPEHTLPAYEFASIMGADVIETDLVLTKDGVLICYHDLVLGHGTNVEDFPEFSHLKRNFTGNITSIVQTVENEWFVKDFTLEEIKKLRVIQKKTGIRPVQFSKMFRIPTFAEFLELVHREAFRLKRPVAIAPEIKDTHYHNDQLGKGDPHYMEDLVLRDLAKVGYPIKENEKPNCTFYNRKVPVPCGNVILQTWDFDTLKYLRLKTDMELSLIVEPDLILEQLDRVTYQGILEISKYANYYATWKEYLYTGILVDIKEEKIDQEKIDKLGGFVPPKKIVEACHNASMKVVIYTIYDSREPSHRGCAVNCEPRDKEGELFYFFEMGVDMMFIENLPEGLELRERYNSMLAQKIVVVPPEEEKSLKDHNNATVPPVTTES